MEYSKTIFENDPVARFLFKDKVTPNYINFHNEQEAHGACIAHLFSPPKLFKGFCYTRDFI